MKVRIKKSAFPLGLIFSSVCLFGTIPPTWSQEHDHDHGKHEHGDSHKAEKGNEVEYLFGNRECPVTGQAVDPDSFVEAKQKEKNLVGRIYMCCDGCEKKVTKDFEDLYNKYYRTDPKTGKAKAPFDLKNSTCPMSGEPVTENDWIEYNGMVVHFCCEGCGKEFLDDPDSQLAKMVENPKDFAYKRPPKMHMPK